MNIDHGKRTWSPRELDQLRDAINAVKAQGVSQAQISREADVPSSTLSQFLSGSYPGDNDNVARRLSNWLDARNREAEVLAQAPPEPGFVMTPTAELVINALRHAQALQDMTIVTGEPGVGKTAATAQYAATTPRVLTITASPAVSATNAVLMAILNAYNHRDIPRRSKAERSAGVRSLLGEGSLLIVDEAQHCSMDALEELRAIHDAQRCGLALLGNESVLTRIQGAARTPAYAQLYSRVGWRVRIKKGHDGDVAPVLETMGVTAPEVVAYAARIAVKDNLRVVVKVVRSAVMLARASRQDLAPQHLAAAYRQLGGGVDR